MSTVVFALIAAYAVVLIAMLGLSQPVRRELTVLVDDMLADDRAWSNAERAHLNWIVESATSSAVGMLLPVAGIFSLASFVLGSPGRAPDDFERLEADPRFRRVTALYFLSVMACSPFAALLNVPIVFAHVLVAAIRGDRKWSRVIEAPVLRASAELQPC